MTRLTQFALGDSRCAQHLVDLLNELGDDRVTRKVCRYLATNNLMCKALIDIENPRVRASFAYLLRKDMVNPDMVVPEHIKTRAMNVAVGHWKRAMEQSAQIDAYDRGLTMDGLEFVFSSDDDEPL